MKKFNFKKLVAATAIALSTISASVFADSTGQTSVWKVSKGNDHVFVGGTVHILPITEFPLPAQFSKAYEQSDGIVLEAKLPEPTDLDAQMAMMQAMSYPQGTTLKDVLSEEVYKKLATYLADFGVNLDEMARFKPGFIMTVMVAMEAQRAGVAGEGVDMYFAKAAKRDGKPQEYLESLEFQINMLASQGEGAEDKLIIRSLDDMDDFAETMKSMISSWRQGDEKGIADTIVEKMKDDKKMFQTMMIDRNYDWVPKIEAMFNDQDKEFVLVGVGHLVGEDNVLQLLEAKGYQIEKL